MNEAIRRQLVDVMMKSTARHENGVCIVYTGYNQHGYGMIRKTIGGKFFRIYTHQLAKFHQLHINAIPAGLVSSHLCHNKACINPDHIIFEEQLVNNQRNSCKNEGRCKIIHLDQNGNRLPDCLF